jgi:PAS domain S-box-containing protein
LIGVNRDITSIKRSQEAVRESEARLRTVAANLPNGTLLLVDADMRILVADGLNFRRNGYHPEKVVGQTIMEAFSNTIGKMSEIILRETFNGQPQTGEFMTDDLRIVSYLTQPIYGANDEIVSALAITQDVTEERKAQAAAFEVESLRVAMSKEQELNDLKTRMMIRISHEFRTPLSVISTSSEMIQRYFERMDANRRAEHFAQIQDYACANQRAHHPVARSVYSGADTGCM